MAKRLRQLEEHDGQLEALKDERIEVYQLAIDHKGKMLIARFEGIVKQVLGDGIMALFGCPACP